MNSLIAHKQKKSNDVIELHVVRPKLKKLAVKIYGLPSSVNLKKFKKDLAKTTGSSASIKKDIESGQTYVFAMRNCVTEITQLLTKTYDIDASVITVIGRDIC